LIQFPLLMFTFTFCAALKPTVVTWDRARIPMSILVGTIWAIPRRLVTASHGVWFTVRAFLAVPML